VRRYYNPSGARGWKRIGWGKSSSRPTKSGRSGSQPQNVVCIVFVLLADACVTCRRLRRGCFTHFLTSSNFVWNWILGTMTQCFWNSIAWRDCVLLLECSIQPI